MDAVPTPLAETMDFKTSSGSSQKQCSVSSVATATIAIVPIKHTSAPAGKQQQSGSCTTVNGGKNSNSTTFTKSKKEQRSTGTINLFKSAMTGIKK